MEIEKGKVKYVAFKSYSINLKYPHTKSCIKLYLKKLLFPCVLCLIQHVLKSETTHIYYLKNYVIPASFQG